MLGLLESEEEMVEDYRILEEDFIYSMELKVLDYIKRGYEPQGGICIVITKYNTKHYQVMVKRKE